MRVARTFARLVAHRATDRLAVPGPRSTATHVDAPAQPGLPCGSGYGGDHQTAGTSPQHTRLADRMYDKMVHLEPTIDQPGFGREWFESNGRTLPAQPAFEWHIEHCDLCLVETTTGTAFNVLRWHR
jgi:hypothetical protein